MPKGRSIVVSIKAFALGKYDITSAEFLTFLKETGYQPAPCNPILDMKWHSAGRPGLLRRSMASRRAGRLSARTAATRKPMSHG